MSFKQVAQSVVNGMAASGAPQRADDPVFNMTTSGRALEEVTSLMKEANAEAAGARETLQKVADQMRELGDLLGPQMAAELKLLREHRMAVVNEARDMLVAIRDIRKFFLEADHKTEMERLDRFIRMCKELKALKEDGTLDAILDSVLRLAVRP
jgi:hypothetical protein